MSKTLADYYHACQSLCLDYDGDLSIPIQTIIHNSEDVRTGCLFMAIRGSSKDGRNYIDDAIVKGAVAIAYQHSQRLKFSVPSLRFSDDYAAFAHMTELYYDYPASNMQRIAITGTNGKTTCAFLLRHIFRAINRKIGLISTVEYEVDNNKIIHGERTTPSAIELQNLLHQMQNAKVELVIMEASSHALTQSRFGSLQFDVAIFTNLTRDHLDYHETMEMYFASKRLLFLKHLKPDGYAIINTDDYYGERLAHELAKQMDSQRIITFGFSNISSWRPSKCNVSVKGHNMVMKNKRNQLAIQSPLIGRFNTYNIMSVSAAALALEVESEILTKALASFTGIPGRLEKITTKNNITIFIDYAHTDAALYNVLHTLKSLYPSERLIVVFGCSGNSDKGKRPRMGLMADKLSDELIITSDNSYDEKPEDIIADILEEVSDENKHHTVIVDRRQAIQHAIQKAEEGDIILIAGKGHEMEQKSQGERIPFNDLIVCREILEEQGLF